jgi:hypothetical protein
MQDKNTGNINAVDSRPYGECARCEQELVVRQGRQFRFTQLRRNGPRRHIDADGARSFEDANTFELRSMREAAPIGSLATQEKGKPDHLPIELPDLQAMMAERGIRVALDDSSLGESLRA